MKKILLTASVCLLTALPVLPDSVPDSYPPAKGLQAIARAKASNKQKILYFENRDAGYAQLEEMAYCYEGMMLGTNEDFMKNHDIYVIRLSAKRLGSKVKLEEEVVFPVWSPKNNAHVLRSAIVKRTVPIMPGKRSRYVGVDGLTHSL